MTRRGHSRQLNETLQSLGEFRIIGKRGHLVLPEVQISSCQVFEIRPIRHGREYNGDTFEWPDDVLRRNTHLRGANIRVIRR